jgi:hypothetical protein
MPSWSLSRIAIPVLSIHSQGGELSRDHTFPPPS